jgi:hypothetical protein
VIEIKSEMHQCVCTECNSQQTEQLVYDKIAYNNILHALLTVVTGIWVVVWIYKRKTSRNETDHNRRLALFVFKCKKCGGALMLSNTIGQGTELQM